MLKKKTHYSVAVIGATGVVGLETLEVLAERKFPVGEIRLYASARSAGERLTFRDEESVVKDLAGANLMDVDLAFISATEEISREWAPKVVEAGGIAIDDSSVFRMDPQVPLVVPEVNASALRRHRGIIAIPNCATTPLVMVLKPLLDAAGLHRVVVTTFQSVSGTGKRAIDELMDQTRAILSFREVKAEVYPYQIAFNCLPHIGSFSPDGDCSEESKIIKETRKILSLPDLKITTTTVRVPVFRCHSESVNIELGRRLPANEVRALLSAFPGLTVYDDPGKKLYPLPIDVAGQDDVYVGRIREDASVPAGVNLWIVSDNLRKGAALNAVQIAEALLRMAESI